MSVIRVRVTGPVSHNGKDLDIGQELDLPAVHCRAAIRAGHLEEIKADPKSEEKPKSRGRKSH